MSSPFYSLTQHATAPKKHKKHKSDRHQRPASPTDKPGLKLILKVGAPATPEPPTADDHSRHHKKSKKKKKKKDKAKDRKHRHHKKRRRAPSPADDEAGSPGPREPRTCVLRQRQERTPVQRLLDQLLTLLEKRDPQQFFAWPVTDSIAPGYSSIITQPMDFSTMRQKVEDNQYASLPTFADDFRLMCTNAMKYNHTETIYYKASKKLLHAGTKIMQPEKLGWVLQLIPELTSEEMGFEITPELRLVNDSEDQEPPVEVKRKMPASKFEPIVDDLTPEEILAKSSLAAREARAKLVAKRTNRGLGFLKQKKDGSTNLHVLVGGDGVLPGTKKRPVLLGSLCGKLQEGTGQVQGFREDRRNNAKPVKPLYYGAFGSYAPSYDSAFSNITKEESDLVYQTYGSDTAVQYAESVLDFVKDSSYATDLVDSLLNLLTGGDHTKTKKSLEENKRLQEEEEAIRGVLESRPIDAIKIDVEDLRSLQDLGIETEFLDSMEEELRLAEERHELQQRLDAMVALLAKLQENQHERLSQPPPSHLGLAVEPGEEEAAVAESVGEGLSEMVRRVAPGEVAPVAGIRKALGVQQQAEEVDLESELRRFLEGGAVGLTESPLRDDKTIEEILME